jgi:hypothetical protein
MVEALLKLLRMRSPPEKLNRLGQGGAEFLLRREVKYNRTL